MPCTRGCCPSNRDHWLSVGVSPSAMPTRTGGIRAAEVNATESRWEKDHAAYRRLRSDGLQPARVDGAAVMEARAESAVEIETGRLMSSEERGVFSGDAA